MRNEVCPFCGQDLSMRAEGECCCHCLAMEHEMGLDEDGYIKDRNK